MQKRLKTSCLITLMIVLWTTSVSAQNEPAFRLLTHTDLYALAWSPDSTLLAVAFSTGVAIYNDTLEQIAFLEEHSSPVLALAWSPDGTQLASATDADEGAIRIWDRVIATNTFTLHRTMRPFHDAVIALSWSPRGDRLASIARDYAGGFNGVSATVQIWDTETWIFERNLIRILDPIGALAWNLDGTMLADGGRLNCATGSEGCLLHSGIYIANVDTGEIVTIFEKPYIPFWLAWSSGNQIVFYEDELTVYDENFQNSLELENIYGYALFEWSQDGERIAGCASDGLVEIIDVATNTTLYHNYASTPLVESIACDWSSDESKFAFATNQGVIDIWDVSDIRD